MYIQKIRELQGFLISCILNLSVTYQILQFLKQNFSQSCFKVFGFSFGLLYSIGPVVVIHMKEEQEREVHAILRVLAVSHPKEIWGHLFQLGVYGGAASTPKWVQDRALVGSAIIRL